MSEFDEKMINLLLANRPEDALSEIGKKFSKNVNTRVSTISRIKFSYLQRIEPNRAFTKQLERWLKKKEEYGLNGNDIEYLNKLNMFLMSKNNRALEKYISIGRNGRSDDATISPRLTEQLGEINPWTDAWVKFHADTSDVKEAKAKNIASKRLYEQKGIIDLTNNRGRYVYKRIVREVMEMKKNFNTDEDYGRVLLCLLLVSGRRFIELMHPKQNYNRVQKFKFYSKTHLAKERGVDRIFEFPLLMDYETFTDLLKRFRKWSIDRFKINLRMNNNEVSRKTNQPFNKIFKAFINSDDNLKNIFGSPKNIKLHTLRKIYLSMVMSSFKFEKNMSDMLIAEELILGHKSGGLVLSSYLQKRSDPIMLAGYENIKPITFSQKNKLLYGAPIRTEYDENNLLDGEIDDGNDFDYEPEPQQSAPSGLNNPPPEQQVIMNVTNLKVEKLEVNELSTRKFNVEE